MMTVDEIFDVVETAIRETGKLPKNKIFEDGNFKYEFYRATKKVDDSKTMVVMAGDDFLDRVDNPNYGKCYYKIYFKKYFGDNYEFCTKSYTCLSV